VYQSEQEYLAELRKYASNTRTLLSNAHKQERERMVARAFLRCTGVQFSDGEIQASNEEPVDVMFRSARFQVRDILGGRMRGKDWREREDRYQTAKSVSDLRVPWTSSKPMSFGEVSQAIATGLAHKASRYGADNCSKLDALVYVDLNGRHLRSLEPIMDANATDEIRRQSWRSVTMLFLPYSTVLSAKPDAPDFLKDSAGPILNKWPNPDGWFDT
jgi:hypothetical protein